MLWAKPQRAGKNGEGDREDKDEPPEQRERKQFFVPHLC